MKTPDKRTNTSFYIPLQPIIKLGAICVFFAFSYLLFLSFGNYIVGGMVNLKKTLVVQHEAANRIFDEQSPYDESFDIDKKRRDALEVIPAAGSEQEGDQILQGE